MLKEKLTQYLEDSIRDNWDMPALADYNGIQMSYSKVAKKICLLHLVFEHAGLKPQDKIALIGKNSANWGVTFLAIVTYGAVAVPILPDFMPGDIQEIVNHSDSKMLFSSESIFNTLHPEKMPGILAIYAVDDLQVLSSRNTTAAIEKQELDKLFIKKYGEKLKKEKFSVSTIHNDDLAIISYTSGTTGHSKGVMLTHNSLTANIRFARNNMPLNSGDKIVSFLPLAHSYGLAFEFIFPFTLGCHITFLTKTPSPQIITQAFAEIRPNLILSVPLVIEKIYKKRLLPTISKPPVSILLKVPLINSLLYKKINKKLTAIFGGNFKEVVIGGAPFNAEAEAFFKKINFPFTVGYGMTECGPLISYAAHNITKLQSSGKPVDTLEIKIDSEDPEKIVGEILIKGENVMKGYYKNEEATTKAIDKDGWLHSGDIGVKDKEGFIFIKGRSKSMILGPSGQNIYPEELESIINNKNGVLESVVVEENGKLIALVCPDPDFMSSLSKSGRLLEELFEEHRKELNMHVPAYMGINKFIIHTEEFEKTPKRSIKRYKYTGKNYSAAN